MKRVRLAGLPVGLSLCVLAGASIAAAAGLTHYEGGSKAKAPYLFITVSQGEVTKVKWKIRETCPDGTHFYSGTTTFNATITNQRFSKAVTHQTPALGLPGNYYDTEISGIKGTIGAHGKTTVTFRDEQDLASLGVCIGRRTFRVAKTGRFR